MRMIIICLGSVLLMPAHAMGDVLATEVWYVEQEAGTVPYKVRYLVNRNFMRSDNGSNEGDFMLYDRRERKIYTVTREERRVLEIDGNGSVPLAPKELAMKIDRSVDEEAPTVDGKPPLQLELRAGDELCYQATVLPGLLPDVRNAFLEFSQALAVQQQRSLSNTPEEFRTPCFLLRYLYASDFAVAEGIPLAEIDGQGGRREMTGYEFDVEFDDSLFVVPDDYNVQRLGANPG